METQENKAFNLLKNLVTEFSSKNIDFANLESAMVEAKKFIIETENESDIRYPYTYAVDFVRLRVYLPRSQVSKVLKTIAPVLGMTHEELAIKLADAFKSLHTLE